MHAYQQRKADLLLPPVLLSPLNLGYLICSLQRPRLPQDCRAAKLLCPHTQVTAAKMLPSAN